MIHSVIDLLPKGLNLSDTAKLYVYLLDYGYDKDKKRPAVIILPGGGYCCVADREAEPVAMQYLSAGYQAFILHYHCAPTRFPVAIGELAESVAIVREHANEWNIDENRIIVNGLSAGGHLAASLGTFWNKPWLSELTGKNSQDYRPNGCILCYPVITSGVFAHHPSINNLLGEEKKEYLEEVSLEHQITKDMPPVFLWHTFTDQVVPVENSLLFAMALREQGISTEFHMYPKGVHGLSLANEETMAGNKEMVQKECQDWIQLAIRWIRQLGGRTEFLK